jgi:hypothetical protein
MALESTTAKTTALKSSSYNARASIKPTCFTQPVARTISVSAAISVIHRVPAQNPRARNPVSAAIVARGPDIAIPGARRHIIVPIRILSPVLRSVLVLRRILPVIRRVLALILILTLILVLIAVLPIRRRLLSILSSVLTCRSLRIRCRNQANRKSRSHHPVPHRVTHDVPHRNPPFIPSPEPGQNLGNREPT